MSTVLTDIRYGIRLWLRAPGVTGLIVLTLALGIGANTTMFSVVNATLLAPLPFPDPDRLITIWKGRIDNPRQFNIVSLQDYEHWQAAARSVASLAVFDSAGRGYNLTGGGEPEQVSGVRVTASFFDVLGVTPLLGRTFVRDEEQPGHDVVVLSHGLWQRRYGGDRNLVGRAIQIDGRAHTVVGVMPPDFKFQFWSGERQLWVPAHWTEGDRGGGSNSFIAIARVKPGVTIAQARDDFAASGPGQARPGEPYDQWMARAEPVSDFGTRDLRVTMTVMLVVVGFVLMIACVNVANLLLARAAARRRELAIRCALGAGRGRVVRQLLTESVLLGLAGGVAGLLLAVWGTSLLEPVLPSSLRFLPMRPLAGIEIDGRVLAFTLGAAVVSGILFGLAPAFAAFRGDLNEPLKAQARGTTAGANRLRHVLVAAEVALTLVALAGAGVMIASVSRLLRVDPGLDTSNVLVMNMALPQENLFYGPPGNPRFCQQLAEQVGAVPGVVAASGVAHLPLSGAGAGRSLALEGRQDDGPQNRPGSAYSVACPGLLGVLGIPLLAGRDFTDRDTVGAPDVALVSHTLATRLWPGEDPLGKRFKLGDPQSDLPWITVVGVFGDIRRQGLDDEDASWMLRPYSQAGWPSFSIVTRTASAPRSFEAAVKKALAAVEPNQPVAGARTMEEVASGSVSSRWFVTMLLSGFALLALVLAAVGISGVVGYMVVQRTPEIGVRMALGAQPRDVLRLLVGDSMGWTVAGVAAGLVGSFGLLRYLQSLLYDVRATDPLVLASVSAVLLAVGFAASYIPARRATRVDPVSALRYE